MFTKRLFLAAAVPALVAFMAASPAMAAPSCQDQIKEIQVEWDKMYPMGMNSNETGNKAIAESFRRVKDECAQGKEVSGGDLDLVRSHLKMPFQPHSHDQK